MTAHRTCCPPLLLLALTPALTAQSVSWRALAFPTPPLAAAWDATRQCTMLLCAGDATRLWEWNGTAFDERLAAIAGGISIQWLGHDPLRNQLVLLGSSGQVGTWDGARWSWQMPPSAPTFGFTAGATFDSHRGRLVVYEGSAGSSAVYEWDGTQWWSPAVTVTPPSRTDAAFAFDPVGQRCVLYGGTSGGSPLGDCWSWNGSLWTQLAASAPPGPRARAAMAFAPALGGMLLYGGTTATTTWHLTGNTWTAVPTAHDPGPRTAALLVRDPFGMLLAGGNGDPHDVGWRFSGADWVAVAEFTAPRYRQFCGVAQDRARGQSVLFGGGAPSAWPTLVFDTRWRGTTSTAAPSARNGPQMCWSSPDQRVLLFGGIDGASVALGDTWSWTGTDWVQLAVATSPSPRYGAQIAEDPNGGVMLFGGRIIATIFGDQWHWNGAQWTQQTPPVLPPVWSHGQAILDGNRGRVVMNLGTSLQPTQTWEWDGALWTLAATTPTTTQMYNRLVGFEPQRGRVVALGVPSFEWTGTTWVNVATTSTTGLSPGYESAVTDDGRQRLLIVSAPRVSQVTDRPAAVVPFGYGCAAGPSPALHAINDPTPGNTAFAVEVGTLAPSALTLLVLGLGSQAQPLGSGCTLLVAQQVATRFGVAPSTQVRFPVPIPNDPGLRGLPIVAQGAVFDVPRSVLGTVTITAGLRITIGD